MRLDVGARILAPHRGRIMECSSGRSSELATVRVLCDDGETRLYHPSHVIVANAASPAARCPRCGYWTHQETPCTTCAAFRYAEDRTQQ